MGMDVEKVKNKTDLLLAEQETRTVTPKEENLPEMLSNSVKENKNPQTRSLEIKPIERSKKDKNFFLSHPKLSLLGVGLIGLVLFSIGRNPKTLAKVIKGTSKAINPKHIEANKVADEIISKSKQNGDFDRVLKRLFNKPNHRSELSEVIADLNIELQNKKIPPESEIFSCVKQLKKKLNSYLDGVEADLLLGKSGYLEKSKAFVKNNEELISRISKLAEQHNLYLPRDISRASASIISGIVPCPKDFLPSNGIYFHGTMRAKGIYKNGFSPFASNSLFCRELGAGIYTTPDVKVASHFAHSWGTVIPVKLNPQAKVAYVDEAMFNSIADEVKFLLIKHLNLKSSDAAMKAISDYSGALTRKLFVEAGYDAAYMPKAFKSSGVFSNLMPDVNKIIGRQQSQLVVFNGEQIEIIDRKLLDRISDTKYKFLGIGDTVKYAWKLNFDALKFICNFFKNKIISC